MSEKKNNELIYFKNINQAKEYAKKINGEIWEIIDIYFIIPKKQAISESIEYTNKILNFCRDKNINYFVYAIIYQSGYLSGFNEQQLEIKKEFLTKIIAKIIIERDLDKKTNITKEELINEFLNFEINLQNNLENNEKFFELIKFPYSDENIKIIDTIQKNIKTLLEIIDLKNPEFKKLPDIINDILEQQSKYLNDVTSGNFYSTNENDLEKLKKELQEERKRREQAELKAKKAEKEKKYLEKIITPNIIKESKHSYKQRFKTDKKEIQYLLPLFEAKKLETEEEQTVSYGYELSFQESTVLNGLIILLNKTKYKGNCEPGSWKVYNSSKKELPTIRYKLKNLEELYQVCGIEKKQTERNKLEYSRKERQEIHEALDSLINVKRRFGYVRHDFNTGNNEKIELLEYEEPILQKVKQATAEKINNQFEITDYHLILEFHPIFIDQLENYFIEYPNPIILKKELKEIEPTNRNNVYLETLASYILYKYDEIRRNNEKAKNKKNNCIEKEYSIEEPFIDIAKKIRIPDTELKRPQRTEKRLISYYEKLKKIELITKTERIKGTGHHKISINKDWKQSKLVVT